MINKLIVLFTSLLGINAQQLPFQKPAGEYDITDEISVDYVLSYEGITPYTTENNISPLKFSNAFESEFIIDTYSNITVCKSECAYDNNCLGLVEYKVNESSTLCNTLSELGPPTETESYSYSYKKITLHRYNHDDHSVTGNVYNVDSLEEFSEYNYKVYIDLNHNGEFNEGEPYNYTDIFGQFEFNNLNPGVYFFRMVVPDACIQYIPSVFGTRQYYYGTGYPDIVLEYYKDGHPSLANIPGGIIGSNSTDVSIDYILKNNQSTYLSFYNKYSITLGLIDETIHDTEGDDIFFTLYDSNNSDIQAHVSISTHNTDYHYLGVLNSNNTSFDLASINYTIPIDHIHLHFFGNDSYGPLNIVSISSKINTSYFVPYTNQWEIPTLDSMYFVLDCGYSVGCSTFCAYHLFHDYEYFSCLNACQNFDTNGQCYCDDQENNFYGLLPFEYDVKSCDRGCDYILNSFTYPDYRAIGNAEGFSGDIITTLTCDNCLQLLIDTCKAIRECKGFDYNENSVHHIFRKYNYVFDNSSYFILKNNGTETNDIGYMTTTTTTTLTTSPSTTDSSTQTTTLTTSTSPSSTVTSTFTSTVTSTLTTTNTYRVDTSRNSSMSTTSISLLIVCLLLLIVIIAMYIINRRRKKGNNNLSDNTGPSNYNASFHEEIMADSSTLDYNGYRDITPYYSNSPATSPGYTTEIPNNGRSDAENGYMDVKRNSRSSINSPLNPSSPSSPISPNRVSVL